MELIKKQNRVDDFKDCLLVHAICKDPENMKRLLDEQKRDPPKENYEVEFKVDGVELNFSDVLNRLEEWYNREVEKKVIELFKDRYHEKTIAIEDLFSEFMDMVKEKYPELKERERDF